MSAAGPRLGFVALVRLEFIQENARKHAGRLGFGAQEVGQIRRRAAELSKLRDELGSLISELAGLAADLVVGGQEDARPGAAEAEAAGDADPASRRPGTHVGPVEVEVGPLRDFAQLTSFEDAAAGIESASDVAVRGLSRGRATFSMSFAQPVDLVSELKERTPFAFSVRAASEGGVVLDVIQADADGSSRAA